MKCHVYRSSVRDGLYVYVPAEDVAPGDAGGAAGTEGDTGSDGDGPPALAGLPAPVRRQLGRAELAMTIELEPGRKLGQEDTAEVLANLAGQGFHVQMPRDIEPLVERVAREANDAAKG